MPDSAIELDVGGTIFKSAPSTLCSNSTYFQALFREEWKQNEGGQPIFIDQDPAPFSELLSYMRKGCIEVEKLTVDVILLAEFLGVERLTSAIKYISYSNRNPDYDGTEEDIVAAFDETYGGIQAAVSTGILPASLRKKKQRRKEYCTLSLWPTYMQKFTPPANEQFESFDAIEPVATIVYPTFSNGEDGDGGIHSSKDKHVSDCPTFLDCLNWLSNHGYRIYEQRDTDVKPSPQKTLCFARNVHRSESDLAMTIIDKDRAKETYPEKKYAVLYPPIPGVLPVGTGSFCCVKADAGKERQVNIESRLFDYESGPQTSKITRVLESSMDAAMCWLHKEGYVERELELESAYNQIIIDIHNRMINEITNLSIEPYGSIKIYSKQLKDS